MRIYAHRIEKCAGLRITMRNQKIFWLACIAILLLYPLIGFYLVKNTDKNSLNALYEESGQLTLTLANELQSELQKFSLLPLLISEYPDTFNSLGSKASNDTIQKLNTQLEFLSQKTGAAYIFVFDQNGDTIASSNHGTDRSFIGRNFKFRPYFAETIERGSSQVFAVGAETGTPGLFLTKSIGDGLDIKGGVVVKVEFSEIINSWQKRDHSLFVINKDDIILFSNDDTLNYKSLSQISESRLDSIRQSRQFGDRTIKQTTLSIGTDRVGKDHYGKKVLNNSVRIEDFDWTMFRALPFKSEISERRSFSVLLLFIFGTLICSILFLWYRRLLRDFEKARQTEFLKNEVERQTREISDANLRLKDEMIERERVNQRFRSAREELGQANRLGSIGAITASVAHEINQPVAAIQTFAENAKIFLKRGKDNKAQENLEAIVELTSKIGLITNQLRRYSRRKSFGLDDVVLEKVFNGVDLLIGERLRSEGVLLSVSPRNLGQIKVRAGRVRLEQVFVNLLQNSLEALEGRPNPKIDIVVDEDKTNVVIRVSDNGKGINPEIIDKIFDPFFTGRSEGLGMGLSIIREIMIEFGGSITVQNSSLNGTTFELHLEKP